MNSRFQRLSSFCPDAQPSVFRRFLSWIHDNQRFASALVILLSALIFLVSVAIHCCSVRYGSHQSLPLIIDHWTGNCHAPQF